MVTSCNQSHDTQTKNEAVTAQPWYLHEESKANYGYEAQVSCSRIGNAHQKTKAVCRQRQTETAEGGKDD